MALLLHISDTHFGTEQVPVVEALHALVRERRPDVLVFSGDVTQRARRSQFAAARAMVDAFGIPQMLALPGNHDVPLFDLVTRAFSPYAGYLAAFGPLLDPVLATRDFFVVGVNTTRASRHTNGEVSPDQVARSVGQLRAARGNQLRIVVTHQPADVVRDQDVHDRLLGAEPALHAWSAAGADLVLGGHIHLPYLKALHARPQPTPRRMWCVQAGTAVSTRIRHGTCNSVNFVHWRAPGQGDARTCRVERCDYSPGAARFGTVEMTELELD